MDQEQINAYFKLITEEAIEFINARLSDHDLEYRAIGIDYEEVIRSGMEKNAANISAKNLRRKCRLNNQGQVVCKPR